jgi:hypothetical protein
VSQGWAHPSQPATSFTVSCLVLVNGCVYVCVHVTWEGEAGLDWALSPNCHQFHSVVRLSNRLFEVQVNKCFCRGPSAKVDGLDACGTCIAAM